MKLTVKSTLSHNGEWYHDGDSIEMTEKEAKELLGLGVVEKPVKVKTDKGETEG